MALILQDYVNNSAVARNAVTTKTYLTTRTYVPMGTTVPSVSALSGWGLARLTLLLQRGPRSRQAE